MNIQWWAFCKAFDFFKAIANGSTKMMERINKRLKELIKEMEERQ